MIVVGIACKTSNAPDAGPHDIPELWGRFYAENVASQIPNKVSDDVIALYCDYEGDYTKPYTVVIGYQVNSLEAIPQGLVAKIVPSGSYAVFHAVGEHPQNLIETWGKIWQSDLNRTYTGDYELYGEKFAFGAPKEVEVSIAIQTTPDKTEEIALKNRQKFAALKKHNLPTDQYAITGSGSLGIRNLREIGDIDILVTPESLGKN